MPTIKFRSIRTRIDFASLQKRCKLSAIPDDKVLFYDLETDSKFAPYAKIREIGVAYGWDNKRVIVRTDKDRELFKQRINDPTWWKFGFNNSNYDDIVLGRHGISVNYSNRHDGFLIFKAIAPLMPAYKLKFINWLMLGDHHFEEGKLVEYQKHTGEIDQFDNIPPHILDPYLKKDLKQHRDVIRIGWDHVIKDPHWGAYMLDLSNAQPLYEMTYTGGVYVNKPMCSERVETYRARMFRINNWMRRKTDGIVTNANSSHQVGEFLDTTENFEIALSDSGNFSIPKKELADLRGKSPIARATYLYRQLQGTIKFYENYLEAANEGRLQLCKIAHIPLSQSISAARTRRDISSSKYGINFQNPNELAKRAQKVPKGFLGVFFDATQVENVVHIYESEDVERRKTYESDPNWNEYVWLCNRILRSNKTKKDLEKIKSETVPNWSVYKLYKTIKLALNFGMGPKKFSQETGIDIELARLLFEEIHEACPAIHFLQNKVKKLLQKYGRVQDVFGHIYSGPVDKAYKVVAYLVQGCGTGSLPKAQRRAVWEVLQDHNAGHVCSTTHDEIGFRVRLDLGESKIIQVLKDIHWCMTDCFSPRFDNIPLRSKLYLTRTTTADAKHNEFYDIDKQLKEICQLINLN